MDKETASNLIGSKAMFYLTVRELPNKDSNGFSSITYSELARRCKLTPQRVIEIGNELIELGLIEKIRPLNGRVNLWRIRPTTKKNIETHKTKKNEELNA